MSYYRIHPYNELSLLMEFPGQPLESAHADVQHWYIYARQHWMHWLKDMIPAYESLMFICKSPADASLLYEAMAEREAHAERGDGFLQNEIIHIPVCYDTILGNDLEVMAIVHHMSLDKIIQVHLQEIYHVYMLGFLPGFAYMGAVDSLLATPRKTQPVATKAGAVGIAGMQTGIYPVDSPGGWHIVGYTPINMFDVYREVPSLLQPGDKVQFEAIDLETYFAMQKIEIESN